MRYEDIKRDYSIELINFFEECVSGFTWSHNHYRIVAQFVFFFFFFWARIYFLFIIKLLRNNSKRLLWLSVSECTFAYHMTRKLKTEIWGSVIFQLFFGMRILCAIVYWFICYCSVCSFYDLFISFLKKSFLPYTSFFPLYSSYPARK